MAMNAVEYAVAVAIEVDQQHARPWSRWFRGWFRMTSRLLHGIATYNMGAEFPHGRFLESELSFLQRRFHVAMGNRRLNAPPLDDLLADRTVQGLLVREFGEDFASQFR